MLPLRRNQRFLLSAFHSSRLLVGIHFIDLLFL
jgi:hypothetical protein